MIVLKFILCVNLTDISNMASIKIQKTASVFTLFLLEKLQSKARKTLRSVKETLKKKRRIKNGIKYHRSLYNHVSLHKNQKQRNMKTLEEIVHSAVSRWAQKRQTEQNIQKTEPDFSTEPEETIVCEEIETTSEPDIMPSDILQTEESIAPSVDLSENDQTSSESTQTESEKSESLQPSPSTTMTAEQNITQAADELKDSQTTEQPETTENTNDIPQDKLPSEKQDESHETSEPHHVSGKKERPAKFTKRPQQRKRSK